MGMLIGYNRVVTPQGQDNTGVCVRPSDRRAKRRYAKVVLDNRILLRTNEAGRSSILPVGVMGPVRQGVFTVESKRKRDGRVERRDGRVERERELKENTPHNYMWRTQTHTQTHTQTPPAAPRTPLLGSVATHTHSAGALVWERETCMADFPKRR